MEKTAYDYKYKRLRNHNKNHSHYLTQAGLCLKLNRQNATGKQLERSPSSISFAKVLKTKDQM